LVLLGDLVDVWLYPIDVVPATVAQIAAMNPAVTQALQSCVANIPNVYFMVGNHDLEVTANDLQPFNAGNKKIQLVTPDWYSAQHPGWRLEHGNTPDMFNAPDLSPDALAGYPLGYFITRLVATAANQSSVWAILQKIIESLGSAHMVATRAGIAPLATAATEDGNVFVATLISTLEVLAEVYDRSKIRFADPAIDNKYTVGDVKTHYQSLYSTWQQKYPDSNQFVSSMLVGYLKDGLDWYAKILLAAPNPPNLLVMGHTHYSETVGAYANDGCWCIPSALGHSDPAPSYVEIVNNTATVIPWNTGK
jgi:UDP-2,3-diacylglucosamine pyrophosphatase LpxH